ncbi:hypothetical protein LTR66_008034 [Elasticomyces elasticus]|nr:hypothetical protein LTR66_008034 [Elasticomyces elasticus]
MLSSDVPLHCNICPKKPTFSDVSHLLTHIASKGHLSHYYKLRVRSTTEDASKKLIDIYDRWYDEWDVEGLMSERMELKERRRSSRRPATATPRMATPVNEPRRRRGHLTLDPRLSDKPVKAESRSVTPYVDPAALNRAYAPPMWSSHPYSMAPSKVEDDDTPDLPVPRARRPAQRSAMQELLDVDIGDEDDDKDDFTVNESSKLKGVFWPGMDIFDSATPDMKRKRNQKKATSVMAQLAANSMEVQATEMVFSPSGALRRQRLISGFPNSDSSPLKGELSPVRRKPSKRPVLADKDVNTFRPCRVRDRNDTFDPFTRPRSFFDDDRFEDDLTYRGGVSKRKRGFGVYNDAVQSPNRNLPNPYFGTDASFGNPSTMDYLTAPLYHYQEHIDPNKLDAKPNNTTFRPMEQTMHDHFEPTNNLFRPAEQTMQDPFVFPPFPYNNNNGAALHPSTNFDATGSELSGLLSNPLYFGSYQPTPEEEDDQRTISALGSDS